jgi:hypothetical protein
VGLPAADALAPAGRAQSRRARRRSQASSQRSTSRPTGAAARSELDLGDDEELDPS